MKKSATFKEEDALFLPDRNIFKTKKILRTKQKFKNVDFSIAQFFHFLAFISPLCITDGKINQSCWTCGGLYMT